MRIMFMPPLFPAVLLSPSQPVAISHNYKQLQHNLQSTVRLFVSFNLYCFQCFCSCSSCTSCLSINSRIMSSHLSHKLPWHLLVDYVKPYKDPGISLPTGTCNRIHITNRRVELTVKNHKYIQEHDICKNPTCITEPEMKIFYKTTKQMKPFAQRPGGQRKLQVKEENFIKFVSYFEKTVLEFAHTELNTPAKDLQYEIENSEVYYSYCSCDRFIPLLEFGDKKKLFEYSDQEISDFLNCRSGNPGIGRHFDNLMDTILKFYFSMNIILHAGLKKEDWPRNMKPDSYFRSRLLHLSDGETFLPHSRKYLSEAMIDLEKTKILNKNLFRFIYFYVMINLKINKNYSFVKDTYVDSWLVRNMMG